VDGTVSGGELISAVDAKITAVRTSSLDLSMNELADMYSAGELIIDPEFQRMFRWTIGAQARFMESLILELPVPSISLIEREDRVYELIDGLQQISSYLHFRGLLEIDNKKQEPLVLQDCDIVKELNGYTFDTLPRALDIKVKRSYIRAEILRKESDPRLRYYMFKRLNMGGEILSVQEARNATIRLLSTDFNNFIINLSANADFNYCIDIISADKRLQRFDQELVLRFFAFKNDFESYRRCWPGSIISRSVLRRPSMKADKVRSELEDDLTWRMDEVRHLRNALLDHLERRDWPAHTMRAILVMQYAHLEGFARNAFSVYVTTVNKLRLKAADVHSHLFASALTTEFDAIRRGSNSVGEREEGCLSEARENAG
jgi:hypothetical protein